MEENKSLALLLVAAIVVSLGGTVVSLNKLGTLDLSAATARATTSDPGIVQLNVTSTTAVVVTQNLIDFGNGYVNSTCNNCTMNTNSSSAGTNYSSQECCLGNWYPLTTTSDTGLYFQNQGNTNLTVNLNWSALAPAFIGGTSPSPLLQYIVKSDSDARACTASGCTANNDDSVASCSWNHSTAWINASTSNPIICTNGGFKPIATQDEAVIDVKVRVPRTATASQKNVTVTFTGTSV